MSVSHWRFDEAGAACMKQEVNLYQVEKKRFKFSFNFRETTLIFAAFFSVLFVVTTVNLVNHYIVEREYNTLDKEQQAKAQKLQVIAGSVPKEKTRNEIIEEVKNYEEQNRLKTNILGVLADAVATTTKPYSEYLDALARRTVPGLWLTHFSIKDEGNNLSFEGKTLNPEYVPMLIAGLGNESVFSNKTFQLFKIATDEKTGDIEFDLETKASLGQP